MRLPSLNIFIDEFPALRSSTWQSGPIAGLFVLSHFHTDHMKGLHAAWSTGVILTSHITKQLLLGKFDGLRGRVFGLPFWCRTPLLTGAAAATTQQHPPQCSAVGCSHHCGDIHCTSADASTVYITLLPAFHIPGSAMIYLEMPSGVTHLYTGDFKFTEAARQSPLRSFLQSHRVDHLYIDDTWLHLGHVEVTQGPSCGPATSPLHGGGRDGDERDESGVRVLSKLLNSEQVAEAMEAIGRRMDHQRLLFEKWQRTRAAEQNSDGDNRRQDASSTSDCSRARQPFVMRVYLHNQFGKEMLIQQLAERLRTRALLDDVRYVRLLTVVEALEEERDDLQAFASTSARAADEQGASAAAHSSPPLLSPEEQAWRASGGEAAQYPYNLRCFVSLSHATALPPSPAAAARETVLSFSSSSPREPPLIEVVSKRSEIDPAALQAASGARGGTPYYGVVISGWARLQLESHHSPATTTTTSGQVWHIPTTLHSTPQEIVDLVALLRPLSVTPLHYRPSRAAVVMQRLGPYLRTPFANQHDVGLSVPLVTCWTLCLPAHILCQESYNSLVVEQPRRGNPAELSPTTGLWGDCRETLFPPPEPTSVSFGTAFTAQGSRARWPGEVGTASSAPPSAKQLLPSWHLRNLTAAFVNGRDNGRKRDRVTAEPSATAGRRLPVHAMPNDEVSVEHEGDGKGDVERASTAQPQHTVMSLSSIADELL
ncbi:hypothetical protein ABB37_07707 [Leptomonas pyrrhocoris]|uniref:DNA repair metallo-beta-lactamase domain-containing protein n=1 Tax=Leptomonas pyrrhocoris TaxID=157538 RepID=A0A0M9FUI5_LEPPY|nr:hypothetical protein ABB37_07707 [Leptomonas pyrrhocoris]KPA76360.1 hypothetical protein ABB37_07707 [Leptomonas pyrrhocoris]|eukprot:XP_015654799.1 hypothetical protein ABB37_07707 [Leptomonas pyrrhocoris]